MIRQRFYLKLCDWHCHIYYVVTELDVDEIMRKLSNIGCRGEDLARAYDNLSSGKCDTGLTYSNSDTHESVVVIAKTSCALEFAQSLSHELAHLANHVAQTYDIPLSGEDVRYIADALLEKTWLISRELICDCCREKEKI